MTTRIRDRIVALDALGANGLLPLKNQKVYASPSIVPLRVLQPTGLFQLLQFPQPTAYTDQQGCFEIDLPWPSESDPNTVTWQIVLPDTSIWGGTVPEAVSGPLTLTQLKTTYGWALVAGPVVGPITLVVGPTGPQGIQGIQGTQGIQGIQGVQGPPGNTLESGVTPPPALANWIWVNQGPAVAADQINGLALSSPGDTSGSWHMLVRALPAPPYTIAARILTQFLKAHTICMGIILRDPIAGSHIAFYVKSQDDLYYSIGLMPAYVVTADGAVAVPMHSDPAWFRIVDDGTVRTYLFSADGLLWITYHSEASGTYIIPTHAGIALTPLSTTAIGLTLTSWNVTSP